MLTIVDACNTKKKNDPVPEDGVLYRQTTDTGYVYAALTPHIVEAAGDAPHGYGRIRFNKLALAALDANGRLPEDVVLPTGAIIVREVYSGANGSLIGYAVMRKDPNNGYANKGWLWAEFEATGKSSYAVSQEGQRCINCHSHPEHRDMTRTFTLR
ncbi:MAG TPA: cytochrome P460 family protein [Cytophagales bacterium]|nr:cytochrome P460 family protein [Cytophagales bacterium]